MGYVIAIIVVIVVIAVAVTLFVMASAKNRPKQGASGSGDSPFGIFGSDSGASPLGDTREHAGDQNREGETVANQDADAHGGSRTPVGSGYEGEAAAGESQGEGGARPRKEDPHVARPVVGGEGEGGRSLQ